MASTISTEQLIKVHLDKLKNPTYEDNSNYEFEVRFNTKGVKLTRIQFEKVIQILKSKGFHGTNGENGVNMLKIQNEFTDPSLVGNQRISKIRTQIEGITNVQKYCSTNDIKKILENDEFAVTFLSKSYIKDESGATIYPVDIKPYNLRISYQKELELMSFSGLIRGLKEEWNESKKIFRYMNRTSFKHPSFPFVVDMSIIKSSTTDSYNKPIPQYKIEESQLFKNNETYEIELELDNSLVKTFVKDVPIDSESNVAKVKTSLLNLVTIILSGIQNTPFPQPYPTLYKMKDEYLELLYGFPQKRRLLTKDFCGPSSYTLQLVNIQPLDENTAAPNIREMYCVTDKADGDRKLLFINKEGLIYLITTNMEFEFTGNKTINSAVKNTLIDGEHITHDKNGKYINLYAAFDIYYVNGKSVRDNAFIPTEEKHVANNFRLPVLQNIVKNVQFTSSQSSKSSPPLTIQCKKFKSGKSINAIFPACNSILTDIENGLYPYETDGLIFTPLLQGVGCNSLDEVSVPQKKTWDLSFKWKPPEFNTIDFLITTIKSKDGDDQINNLFKEGNNLHDPTNVQQFKIIQLRCGFDEKKHGFINPFDNIYNDTLPSATDLDDENTYKPVPFYPTNPSDSQTHLCHIILKKDSNGDYQMMTEDGTVFYDNTIIEFKYEHSKPNHFKWIPIKIRNDKTDEFRKGQRNFGNAYHVANSNWYSIHNPVNVDFLKTGENIPSIESDQDVYYNRNSKLSFTEALRHFHNRVVKYALINGVSKPSDTLIDFAVGKAGDLSKWIYAKLSFVYGLDISKDNIENRIDGACARFLQEKKKRNNIPDVMFLQANSSVNIRDGTAFYNEKDRLISKMIFGDIPKKESMGKGVLKHYGKGHSGFNIASCQFALHYFFQNKKTLSNFMKNLAESVKIGGYFIGTCYDGTKIFNDLKTKENMSVMKNSRKIWEVTKSYSSETFHDDETSLGYPIDVYQETINKTIREYLVNFNYLIRIMENYGFRPITNEESRAFRLTTGIGNFKILFDKLVEDKKRNPSIEKYIGKSLKMSPQEKKISYYNNYFIFVKTSNPEFSIEDEINPEKVSVPAPITTIAQKEPILSPPTLAVPPKEQEKKTVAKKRAKKIKLVKKPN